MADGPHRTGAVTWVGIGAAIVAWFIGLLVEVGPAVHLLLVLALALLAIEAYRRRAAATR